VAYTGTNGETRDTDKILTLRTTAPALDPTTSAMNKRTNEIAPVLIASVISERVRGGTYGSPQVNTGPVLGGARQARPEVRPPLRGGAFFEMDNN
jgi:hypothetical protein